LQGWPLITSNHVRLFCFFGSSAANPARDVVEAGEAVAYRTTLKAGLTNETMPRSLSDLAHGSGEVGLFSDSDSWD